MKRSLLPIPTLLLLWLWLSAIVSAQTQDPITTTVIDLLSQNVEFSYFLRLLQRSQLIPYLNQLVNITLAAPVNSAFVDTICSQDITAERCMDEALGAFSKANLNQYIINQPISSSSFDGFRIAMSIIDEQTQRDDESLPIIIHTDLSTNTFEINNKNVVEMDLYADSQNSYVQGLDRAFDLVKSSHEVIDTIPKASRFKQLLNGTDIRNKTIVLPLDSSFTFTDYQFNYLLSPYGQDDSDAIVNSLLIDGLYGGNINETVFTNNRHKVELNAELKGAQIIVNNTLKSLQANKLAKDAIIHIFEDKSLIESVNFNAMKTLIGLDAASFVDELVLQKLENLITDNSLNQTIFYSKDSNAFSATSKSSNLYHFIPERIDNLLDAKPLYDTKFCNTRKLGGLCQRIKIDTVSDDSYMLNNNVLIEEGPFVVGNSVIYMTDDNLRTPGGIISSVNPIYHCSKSINYLFQLSLHKLFKNEKGYTLLLPCYDSYDDFKLTFKFLERNRTALDLVMKNLIFEGLLYSDVQENVLNLNNLNGEPVTISNITSEDDELSLDFNNDRVRLKKNHDILFQQGVIHPIGEFVFPPDLKISLKDIISNSDADVFLSFMKTFPRLSELIEQSANYSILLPSAFSLSRLNPFDKNSTLENFLKLHIIPSTSLEKLYNCEDDIQTLNPKVNLTCSKVTGHGDALLQIKNGAEFSSHILTKGCTPHFKGQGLAQGHACVYSIDKPIDPDWISNHYHISLPGIALGIGIILGSFSMLLLLMIGSFFVLRKRKDTQSDLEPGDQAQQHQQQGQQHQQQQDQDVDENTRLINGHGTQPKRAGLYTRPSFEQGYSDNANVDPITVSTRKVSFVGVM